MVDTPSGAVETLDDFGTDDPGRTVRRWMAELKAYKRTYGKWEDDVRKIVKRYREEEHDQAAPDERDRARRFGILWSSVQTAAPLLYARTPIPTFSRRFKDPDPVGRTATEALERAVASLLDRMEFDSPMIAARLDYQLAGRGQVWVRYVPVYGEEEASEGAESFRPVIDERIEVEHLMWRDFRHGVAPSWSKVPWVARRVMMTRAQLRERFGRELADQVPMTARMPGMGRDEAADYGDAFLRAEIWEIWDKLRREVIWIAEGLPTRWLDRKKDPLGLRGFFPCPTPLYATVTTDSLVPVPDATEWKSQAAELDVLTERIALVTKAIKAMGFYDGSIDELVDLLNPRLENRMIAVDSWLRFAEQGGFKGAVDFLPIEMFVGVVSSLIEIRAQTKQDFYEVSGLADVVRGASDPRETARAQEIKSRFAGARLEDRQRAVQRFARDTIEIVAEIVAEHFDLESLAELANWPHALEADPQVFAQAVQLLRDDRLRTFRIDIETDSTILPDRRDERAKRVEFMEVITPFMEKALEALQQAPEMAPLIGQLLMFTIRGFDAGRELESTFEQAMDGIGQIQRPPDPRMAEIDGKQRIEAQKIANEHEVALGRLEVERGKLQIEMAKLELDRLKALGEESREAARLRADIEARQAEIRNRTRQIDIESEELLAKREETEARLDIETERLGEERAVRGEERARAESANGAQEDMAETVEAMGELGEALSSVVDQLARSVAASQEAQTEAIRQFSAIAERMVAAATAPRELIRENGEIRGSRIVAQGPETLQ